MEARKGRVKLGSMSGRSRQPGSGDASARPKSSAMTCGGGSTSICNARHRATRTAVGSGAAMFLSAMERGLNRKLPAVGVGKQHLQGGPMLFFERTYYPRTARRRELRSV